MCRSLIQSHACGHHVTLKKEPCFLLRNELECKSEEKKQIKTCRGRCRSCRKYATRQSLQGVISASVSQGPAPWLSQEAPAERRIATPVQVDPVTIISNLKELCARVVANQCAKKRRTGESEATTALKEKPTNPGVRQCQDEIQLASIEQPWTQENHPTIAESLRKSGEAHPPPTIPPPPTDRSVKHPKSPLCSESRGSIDQGVTDIKTISSGKCRRSLRRRSSIMSTTSARSAKRRINESLRQEFETTAHLGEIILQSPDISPAALDNHDEYNPARSYLGFVKHTGYGQ